MLGQKIIGEFTLFRRSSKLIPLNQFTKGQLSINELIQFIPK